jgi:hypothetical protein
MYYLTPAGVGNFTLFALVKKTNKIEFEKKNYSRDF